MSSLPDGRLTLAVVDAPDAPAYDLGFTNVGAIELVDVAIPINEFSLDFSFLDDTHMPADFRLPPLRIARLGAAQSFSERVSWILRREPWAGDLRATFRTSEHDPTRHHIRVPFTMDVKRRDPRAASIRPSPRR